MSIIVTPRRAQRVSHEIQRREVQVRRVESPSPGFRRIVFGGDSLAGFVSLSFDDHLKFIFDDAAGQPQRRDYTPRRYDAARGELTVDFALHGHGPAAAWAAGLHPHAVRAAAYWKHGSARWPAGGSAAVPNFVGWTVGQAQRADAGVELGQSRVGGDAGAAMGLDRVVDDLAAPCAARRP
jgi:hypothetical protein